jgi:hypothetical protein
MKANFSAGFTAWAARPSVFVGGLGYQDFWVLGFYRFGFGLPAFSSLEAAAALCAAGRVDLL